MRGGRFLPDGSRIVTTARDGTVRVRDTASGTELGVISLVSSFPNNISASPDGSCVAVSLEVSSVAFFSTQPARER